MTIWFLFLFLWQPYKNCDQKLRMFYYLLSWFSHGQAIVASIIPHCSCHHAWAVAVTCSLTTAKKGWWRTWSKCCTTSWSVGRRDERVQLTTFPPQTCPACMHPYCWSSSPHMDHPPHESHATFFNWSCHHYYLLPQIGFFSTCSPSWSSESTSTPPSTLSSPGPHSSSTLFHINSLNIVSPFCLLLPLMPWQRYHTLHTKFKGYK